MDFGNLDLVDEEGSDMDMNMDEMENDEDDQDDEDDEEENM